MIEERLAEAGGLPHYTVPGDALEYGASLGNAHCWLSTRGSGSIQQFFSTDTGATITGSISVRYGGAGHHLLRASAETVDRMGVTTDVQLHPVEPGTIELHPAYQRRDFALPEGLQVRETVFVPLTHADDPAVAYYMVEVHNRNTITLQLQVLAFARLGGSFASKIAARYDEKLHGLVAVDREHPTCVRVFGCTAPVIAHETNHDYGLVYDVYHVRRLENDTSAEGDILGALQVTLDLQQDERRSLAFVMAFSHSGEADAIAIYRKARKVEDVLAATIEHITRTTSTAQVLTPDPMINTGVLWSKVNMLRVMACYPQGLAFTNDPGVSSNVVGRDVSWFVYGNDHFSPDFSSAMLDTFARLQYGSGKIPEFYSAVDGHVEDYGLNINDDTPLFILAVNHHYRATGDLDWLRGIYPTVAKAGRYILSQRDERGLVFCTAQDPRGNMWAIASWRNVIPDYSLNGAVTELNAECVAALRALGHLTQNLGRDEAEAQQFFKASEQLRQAMDRHLINPHNGLYYLTIDTDGIARTDVTGDQLFPVMFRTCSEEVGFRIIRRLNHPDFWTSAGLRTTSADDPLYDPARNLGLLGGVWPGLTWWFAFAAARYHPELMVQGLKASFAHYASNPKSNNTVPGQFGEWFDGESLTNRGMRLSPWEPPRFLWAAVEGVCGVMLQPGNMKIQPLVPPAWRWVALCNLPYHGEQVTYFATREEHHTAFHIYATTELDTEHTLDVFAEDATARMHVLDPQVSYVALRRPDKVVVLLGHTGASTSIVPVELGDLLESGTHYKVSLYDSEAYVWRTGGDGVGKDVGNCAVTIEAGGFRLLAFERA